MIFLQYLYVYFPYIVSCLTSKLLAFLLGMVSLISIPLALLYTTTMVSKSTEPMEISHFT